MVKDMNTSEKVLFLLESNKDIYTSGEEMARQCGVSRNAVWKAIRDLREKGYVIEAVSNKGYKLSADTDIISVEGIKAGLPEDLRKVDIIVYDSLDSTSDRAKELAMKGADHGTVVVAVTQTGGRGRKDHSFFSPEGGLYMSTSRRRARCAWGRSHASARRHMLAPMHGSCPRRSQAR